MLSLLSPSDILRAPDAVGPKARMLATLWDKGFAVPFFVAIPPDGIARLPSVAAAELQRIIGIRVPAKRYAVRSAAFGEDMPAQSRAGAFRTELDVAPERLHTAIRIVVDDAYLKGESRFSVIVQEYIPCDVSGVTFTRNPLGGSGREMRAEWHRGTGSELVGGAVRPEHAAFAWTGALPHTGLPDFAYAVREWKKIEQLFGSPQDIEWCIRKKDWYVLQARPITTITAEQHRMYLRLDAELPSEPFLYEKTEITEMAPRPSAATLSLLQRIHVAGGPAERAYASLGFRYRPADFLVTVAGNLYVDREKELHALLPSFSHLSQGSGPRLRRFAGLRTTMQNVTATQKLQPESHIAAHREALTRLLRSAARSAPFAEALHQFDAEYEHVMAANIAAAKALQLLQRALQGQPVSLPLLLSSRLVETAPYPLPPSGIVGNSLEFDDQSPFFAAIPSPVSPWEITQWWNGLPAEKRAELEPVLRTAQEYAMLREVARWAAVSLLHPLRDALLRESDRQGLDRQLAFDATLEEYATGAVDPQQCAERHARRQDHAGMPLPSRLSSRVQEEKPSAPLGVSPGSATGVLVTPHTIAAASGPVVLAVPTLSPDLTRHFTRIGGIVAEHGGLLSHLAIVARERRIPVVTNVSFAKEGIHAGDVVDINGTTGEVRVLKRHSSPREPASGRMPARP